MKAFMKVVFALVVGFFMFQAQSASAGTTCIIQFHNAPCFALGPNPAYRPEVGFQDGDRLANLNGARCIERAAEYKNWCQSPAIEVTTYFVVDGRSVIGSQTNRNGKVYIFDGIARFLNFHN